MRGRSTIFRRVVKDENVVWHEPGRSSLAGDYKSREAVVGFLLQLRERSGGSFKIEVLDILTEPERVVVLQRKMRRGRERPST